ncbi:A-kinase anchor protein 13 isoform X1 [Histomonas meleagridis]|uniref:A-kinase anchor protein 13 isoform X1 n=1 Tax=Histomonas meleagridis TaxID=135588 RepID=UPI0035596301|nr:A-kinase anchor protein 13 isoform X1 [Histomonas meleagridis]KAH0800013.1 A-kinase anchor protein 13 isoform X1 [Histomonas meleagridis]
MCVEFRETFQMLSDSLLKLQETDPSISENVKEIKSKTEVIGKSILTSLKFQEKRKAVSSFITDISKILHQIKSKYENELDYTKYDFLQRAPDGRFVFVVKLKSLHNSINKENEEILSQITKDLTRLSDKSMAPAGLISKLQSDIVNLSNNFGVLYPDDKSYDIIKEYENSIFKAEFIISTNELEKIAKNFNIEYEGLTETPKAKEEEPAPKPKPKPAAPISGLPMGLPPFQLGGNPLLSQRRASINSPTTPFNSFTPKVNAFQLPKAPFEPHNQANNNNENEIAKINEEIKSQHKHFTKLINKMQKEIDELKVEKSNYKSLYDRVDRQFLDFQVQLEDIRLVQQNITFELEEFKQRTEEKLQENMNMTYKILQQIEAMQKNTNTNNEDTNKNNISIKNNVNSKNIEAFEINGNIRSFRNNENNEDVGSLQCNEDIGSLQSFEEIASIKSIEDVGSLQGNEDNESLQSLEDVGSLQCNEDMGSLQCNEDMGSLQCNEDMGSLQCNEDMGSLQGDEDIGSLRGDEDVGSLQSYEDIISIKSLEEIPKNDKNDGSENSNVDKE